MNQKVLLVLPDRKQSLAVESVLRKAGFEVYMAPDRTKAIRLMSEKDPEFILLDGMIAEIGSILLCRIVRSTMNMPETNVIMLSDSQESSDPAPVLPAGADAYLFKPLDMQELLALMARLQSQHRTISMKPALTAGDIEMVPEHWLVYVAGTPVKLTETEYRLLEMLLKVKGRVLTRETLLEQVWGHQQSLNIESRTLDVHMSRLRQKLGPSAANIITVRNVGYRINLAPEWLNQ